MKTIISAAIVCGLLTLAGYGQESVMKARISIDTKSIVGPVNQFVFGQNTEAAEAQYIFGQNKSPVGKTGSGLWDRKNKTTVAEVVQMSKDAGVKVMRYPGGCLVHNFDWKMAVGPVDERPDFTFGVDEFIEYCRAVGAEPLMNVAVYVGTPEDKAELVEYLNAPATADHPWAMKRAQWGHKEPYGVRYFEIGNEEDHGNHNVKPFKKFTVQQYTYYYLKCWRTMKQADPSIKMGPHLGTGTGPYDKWNAELCKTAKDSIDFLALHTYQVGYHSDANIIPADTLMRACMAGVDDFIDMLAEYRRVIRENAGRDIPLAITEYNGMFVQEKPIPYRFAYGTALFCGDYLRVLMQPEQNILMANYWQFINGYWGYVRGPNDISTLPDGKTAEWKKLPAYYVFRLWAQHFGTTLVSSTVESPKISFDGALRVEPRRNPKEGGIKAPELVLKSGSEANAAWDTDGKMLTVKFNEYTGERYPAITTFAVSPSTTYRITFKARTTGATGTYRIGIGLMDARGWTATKSAAGVEDLQAASAWSDFKGAMTVLPDCEKLIMLWRIIGKDKTPFSATVEVKDIEIKAADDKPPFDAMTAAASMSRDGKKLYLMVFNKHTESDITADIAINGSVLSAAKLWQVNGPLTAVNGSGEQANETVTGLSIPVRASGSITGTFPAHSMTAIECMIK
ncbi:MAG: hypothetical protein HZC28_11680 [Spirochaetes bacterium]|nr:hypothetical protein [Spirochaetota bacterium]